MEPANLGLLIYKRRFATLHRFLPLKLMFFELRLPCHIPVQPGDLGDQFIQRCSTGLNVHLIVLALVISGSAPPPNPKTDHRNTEKGAPLASGIVSSFTILSSLLTCPIKETSTVCPQLSLVGIDQIRFAVLKRHLFRPCQPPSL